MNNLDQTTSIDEHGTITLTKDSPFYKDVIYLIKKECDHRKLTQASHGVCFVCGIVNKIVADNFCFHCGIVDKPS